MCVCCQEGTLGATAVGTNETQRGIWQATRKDRKRRKEKKTDHKKVHTCAPKRNSSNGRFWEGKLSQPFGNPFCLTNWGGKKRHDAPARVHKGTKNPFKGWVGWPGDVFVRLMKKNLFLTDRRGQQVVKWILFIQSMQETTCRGPCGFRWVFSLP